MHSKGSAVQALLGPGPGTATRQQTSVQSNLSSCSVLPLALRNVRIQSSLPHAPTGIGPSGGDQWRPHTVATHRSRSQGERVNSPVIRGDLHDAGHGGLVLPDQEEDRALLREGLTSPPGAGGQRLQRQHGTPAPVGLSAVGPVSTAVPVSPGHMPCGHRKLPGAHAVAICCPDKPALQPERADGESEEPGSPRPIPRSPQEPVPAGVKNPLREKPSRQIGNQKS